MNKITIKLELDYQTLGLVISALKNQRAGLINLDKLLPSWFAITKVIEQLEKQRGQDEMINSD